MATVPYIFGTRTSTTPPPIKIHASELDANFAACALLANANIFTDDQIIQGDLSVTGTITGATVAATGSLTGPSLATGSTTARTLANRFAQVVLVEDFGAVGDGTTDDTAAIDAAHVVAEAQGLILTFMPKTYVYTGPMVVTTTIGGIEGLGATLKGTGSAGNCFEFGAGNFESGAFHLPNITDYANGAGIRFLGTANADIYCHSIYSCKDGFLHETSASVSATINNRFKFMKIGTCTQSGIHLKAGVDASAGHQSQQGLKVNGNFIQGCKWGVYNDYAANQTPGMNDIEIDVDGIDGLDVFNRDQLVGTTHGTTTMDGIADTSTLVAGPISGPGVDVGTTFIIAGPNSITLSQAATSSETAVFYCNSHIGFYCPTGAMNGPWLLRCREFMGGNGLGDIIITDGANGLDFECGWPASPAYGATKATGTFNSFKNTFQQGSGLGSPVTCVTTSNTRSTFNSGRALGYNRMHLVAPLDVGGVTAGTLVSVYAYSPFLCGFGTALKITPIFSQRFAITACFDDSVGGHGVPYQIRIDLYCLFDTPLTPPDQSFLIEVGI